MYTWFLQQDLKAVSPCLGSISLQDGYRIRVLQKSLRVSTEPHCEGPFRMSWDKHSESGVSFLDVDESETTS